MDEPLRRQPGPAAGGRLGRAFARMFMKQTRVVEVQDVAERFRLVTLESAQFRGAPWALGQKLQIAMGSAFVARTFTPMNWDAVRGRTRILAYLHGTGPASAWMREVEPGLECDILGPRASLDLRGGDACALIGDETSIGLAYSIAHAGRLVALSLEVADVVAVKRLLDELGVEPAKVWQRQAADAHLVDIESQLPALAAAGVTFVLTGRAQTIQKMRSALKGLGVPAGRMLSKAYWAPGKTGLD